MDAANNKSNASTRSVRIIVTILVIAALYLSRDVLIPVALAILLMFLLQPLVNRLRHIGFPKVLAVGLVVLVLCAVTGGIGMVVGSEFYGLTKKIPEYRENLIHKAHSLRSSADGVLANIDKTLVDIKHEIAASQPTLKPVPVISVVDNGPNMLDILSQIAPSILAPLTEAAIVLFLLIFLLLHSDNLRERFVSMANARQIRLTTAALDEAVQRVGAYLRMQLAINLTYGVLIAIGMFFLGLPSAIFFGAMATVLRFVPFVGPWIAGGFPTLLSIAVFEGWRRPLGVVGIFALVELMTNTIMEPWLYGRSSGITSLGVACAAVFWAWVWGPFGLILAVPLTVCIMVAGKQAPGFSVLNDLFGEEIVPPRPSRRKSRAPSHASS